ncbi:MAG TPA: PP2C family protein-serine/threonine phosphatase [Streptosporangiaceae bacterium]|nr:PP2C family protein-serine/threonine phosphatase [Streptosporangiaceae bacterium]
MRVTRWLAPLAAPASALQLVPVVVLAGLLVLGVFQIPDIKPALTGMPALAAAFSRHPWYPLAVGGFTLIVSYVLTAEDSQALDTAEATATAVAITVVSALGALGVVIRERQGLALTQTRMVAEAVQSVLARPIPDRIGPVRAAVHYTAAHAYAKIGGDLYEVVQTRYGVRAVVGDVQGKGLDAIGTAAALLGAFREAAHEEPGLPELARRLAEPLERAPGGDGERFVTAVLMGISPDGSAQLANCGHPSPLLLRGSEPPRALDPASRVPPLGILPPDQVRPPVLPVTLQPGDRVLLYTDGVIEARDPAGAFYPLTERLPRTLRDDPGEALERLSDDVLRHVGSRLDDDAAMVLLEYAPLPGGPGELATARPGAPATAGADRAGG